MSRNKNVPKTERYADNQIHQKVSTNLNQGSKRVENPDLSMKTKKMQSTKKKKFGFF